MPRQEGAWAGPSTSLCSDDWLPRGWHGGKRVTLHCSQHGTGQHEQAAHIHPTAEADSSKVPSTSIKGICDKHGPPGRERPKASKSLSVTCDGNPLGGRETSGAFVPPTTLCQAARGFSLLDLPVFSLFPSSQSPLSPHIFTLA